MTTFLILAALAVVALSAFVTLRAIKVADEAFQDARRAESDLYQAEASLAKERLQHRLLLKRRTRALQPETPAT